MARKIRIRGHAKRDQEAEVKAKVAFEKEALKVTEKNSVLKTLREDPRPYTEGQSFPVVSVEGQLHRSADRLYVRTGGRWELVQEGGVSETPQNGDAVYCTEDDHVYYFMNGIWRIDDDMGGIMGPEEGWTWQPPVENPPIPPEYENPGIQGEPGARFLQRGETEEETQERVNSVGRCMSCKHWDYQSTDGLMVWGTCMANNTEAEADSRPCSWAEPRVSEVGMNERPRERGFIHFTLNDRLARWIFIGTTFFVLAGITTQVLYGG